MRLTVAILFVLATFGCGSGSSPVAPSEIAAQPDSVALREGFYHTLGPWGDYRSELPAGSFCHVVAHNGARVFTTAELAGGCELVIDVTDLGFYPTGGPIWDMRSDWEASYSSFEKVVRPIKAQVMAIYVMDEPSSKSIPPNRLETAIEWWNSKGYPTMVVNHITRDERPFNVTYYGVSGYRKVNGRWTMDWEAMRASEWDIMIGMGFAASGQTISPEDIERSRELAEERQAPLLWFLWPTIEAAGVVGLRDSGGF